MGLLIDGGEYISHPNARRMYFALVLPSTTQ
jgi:hypothetical protein